MSLLFKNYSLKKVIYLLISCYKTRFFLSCETNNTDRNGVNKEHAHTSNPQSNITLSMKISDTPLFQTAPPLFYQPLHFYGKNLNPPFFQKFRKLNSIRPPPPL